MHAGSPASLYACCVRARPRAPKRPHSGSVDAVAGGTCEIHCVWAFVASKKKTPMGCGTRCGTHGEKHVARVPAGESTKLAA
eukprot:3141142-Alexandrium_andersonii.AAC.1